MEYNQPSEIVKDINFGNDAKSRVIAGVEKLAKAVKSTLGASGKCVIYEDARGLPVITKDGVTVAESVVLFDPVENMGATLIKEAARNTVREAGDGTTTATVLAESLLKEVNSHSKDVTIREAPIFSTGSNKTTDSATVTPSFVMTGSPLASSYITHFPDAPRVDFTALASFSTPAITLFLASLPKFISLTISLG